MDYEAMMKQLEEITRRLETQSLPLAEATRLYKEGMEISRKCHELLDKAELEVQQVEIPASNTEAAS